MLCKTQNKYIQMKNTEQMQYQQTQDDIITSIRSIASSIFDDGFEKFEQFNGVGFRLAHQNFQEFNFDEGDKKHSYTQRNTKNERQQCQSQWINYEDFQKRNQDFQTKVCSLQGKNAQIKIIKQRQQIQQKVIKKQNKSKIPTKQQKKDKNISKIQPQTKIDMKKNNQTKAQVKKQPPRKTQNIQQKSAKSQVVNKIKLQNLSQYGFMKKQDKLKQQMVNEIYKKKEKSIQQQNIQPKKHFKTLQQLYQQKQPLYQKYLKDRQKKLAAIYQSRLIQQQMLLQYQNPMPQINRHVVVEGSFQQRLKISQKKAKINKNKIINDMLSNSPFQPQLNNSKKYKQVESRIKKVWSQSSFDLQNSYKSERKQDEDFEKVPQLFSQQNMKYEVKTRKSQSRSSNFNYRLSSTAELSNILEIQDNFHE